MSIKNLSFLNVFLFLSIIITGCGNSPVHQKVMLPDSSSSTDSSQSLQQSSTNSNVPGTIQQSSEETRYLHFTNNKCEQNLKKEKDSRDTLTFYGSNNQTIHAIIKSDKEPGTAIRFSQIIMPDGTMDGPFSTEIIYKLHQQGYYKLIVGDNLMAADHAFTGKYSIIAELK